MSNLQNCLKYGIIIVWFYPIISYERSCLLMIKRYLFTGIITIIIATTATSCSTVPQASENPTIPQPTQSTEATQDIQPTTTANEYTFDETNMYSQKLGRAISADEYECLKQYIYQETSRHDITAADVQCSLAATALNIVLENTYPNNIAEVLCCPVYQGVYTKDFDMPFNESYWNSSTKAVNSALGGYDPTDSIGGANFYVYSLNDEQRESLENSTKGCVTMELNNPYENITFCQLY